MKPGMKKLLLQRGKELNKEKRGRLNLLLVRQAYLIGKLHGGSHQKVLELRKVQLEINVWYQTESEKIKIQSKIADAVEEEHVRIFHHELHKRHIRKSSILKLTPSSEDPIIGHEKCAEFLEQNVSDILTGSLDLEVESQKLLLNEVERYLQKKITTF